MDLRTRLCFAASRRLLRPPAERTVDYAAYGDWRRESLSTSWSSFSDDHVRGKDVLDFGCGDGPLSIYLAHTRGPRSIVGVDLNSSAIERARESGRALAESGVSIEFRLGTADRIPAPDGSVDTLLAFDCLEHVMSPAEILAEWRRVLRPSGRCLIEWFPFKGPWGPHMESLIPIPWAHVLFGERAMFRAAELIYDLPEFTPRHWDLDEGGRKRPNKWRTWSTFEEQGYVNQLDVQTFCRMAGHAGFHVARLDRRGFGGPLPRKLVGSMLKDLPVVGDYFVSSVIVELLALES